MATHYLFNSLNETPIYLQAFESCDLLGVYENNTPVTVLEEFIGENCMFHYVQLNNQDKGFVSIDYVSKYENTKPFAPYICSNLKPNYAYRIPDWTNLTESSPFFNEIDLKYYIVVRVCYETLGNVNKFNKIKNDAICKAVTKLFTIYGKNSSKEEVEKYLNYYSFADFADYYLPARPNAKIRCLISLPKKYLDAISDYEDNTPVPQINSSFTIKLSELDKKIKYAVSLINSYAQEATINSVNFNYSLTVSDYSTKTDNFDFNDTFVSNIKNGIILDLYDKAKQLEKIPNILKNYLKDNNFEFGNSKSYDFFEFAINDKCNKIYDVSYNKQGTCNKLIKFKNIYLNSTGLSDPTIVNFLKNLNALYQIERCNVSLNDFTIKYTYPRIKVNFSDIALSDLKNMNTIEAINLITSYFTKFETEYNKFITFNEKEYEESLVKLKEAAKSYKEFPKLLSVGVAATEFNYGDINEVKNTLKDLLPNEIHHDVPEEDLGNDAVATKLETSNLLNKIYAVLQSAGGLCKLTSLGFACLASLLELLGVDATITISTLKTYNLNELKQEILPNIDSAQQTYILDNVITQSCITKEKMLYLLKNNLDEQQYTSMLLEDKSFNEVKQILISYMLE